MKTVPSFGTWACYFCKVLLKKVKNMAFFKFSSPCFYFLKKEENLNISNDKK
jgi:hypothetical protein